MAKFNPKTAPSLPEIPAESHPDYLDGIVSDDTAAEAGAGMPPDGPSLPDPFSPIPRPIPLQPITIPRFCGPVSGRYVNVVLPQPGPFPIPVFSPRITVRIDVDRFFPQNRISIEYFNLLTRTTAHVIATVTSDVCMAISKRKVEAEITYRDGDAASAFPGNKVIFEALRGIGAGYGSYRLTLTGSGSTQVHQLKFVSRYFDPVEFEMDRVDNAGDVVTSIDTHAHPNRPTDLPAETLSLATVYQRAGFDVSMSPNESVIPVADAGANGTWSDDEMHNAMVTYWSRFQDRAQWAMWVLYAARHDQGRGLGGIMFDDIGPNHRQGTALFTDSFIQDAPASDPNAVAWRRRMVFWTAVHEMGHAFNLAHAWQKTLGTPWTSVVNEPEGRSFMNYPFRVTGGQASFFSDFRHRFSDQELLFMRHAPRRFVQMGNSNWFDNHAFESPSAREKSAAWALAVRPNRTSNTFQFLEPVVVELKLTNLATRGVAVDDDLLSDGMHVAIMIRRDGGQAKRWRPFITRCHEEHEHTLKPGEALYASHAVSMAPAGWLIDEPGFYSIQAMLEVGGEVVHSNVLRIYVAPSNHHAENRLAPDYFTENVGRAIAFGGAPSLADANTVLQAVAEECKENPARIHAVRALTAPLLTPFKVLAFDDEKPAIRSLKGKLDQASKALMAALVEAAGTAADTLGHIGYFGQLDDIAAALEDEGDAKAAKKVLHASVAAMKEREILPAVIQQTEKRLAKM